MGIAFHGNFLNRNIIMQDAQEAKNNAAGDPQLEKWANDFHRSSGEEWANAATHGAGLIFGIFALTFMCVLAAQQGDAKRIVSCAIYGSTLIVLYNFSMLYHLIWKWRVKAVFQIMDHISIYLLIAGTYTPFSLVTLSESWRGWTVFGIAWGLALIGILSEILIRPRKEWLALTITLLMGWQIIMVFKTVCANLDLCALTMLIIGGVTYTLGVIFYAMDRTPYMHTVWHCFVLGGTVCHWVAITFGVILQ